MWLDKNLDSTRNKHVDTLLIKLKQNIGLLRKSKNMLNKAALNSIYYAHFHIPLCYSRSVWGSMLSAKQMQKLQKMQNTCLKIIEPHLRINESLKKIMRV